MVPLDEVAIYGMNFILEHDGDALNRFYNINVDKEDGIVGIYDETGRSRGLKLSGNEINYEAVTERVIYDIRNAKNRALYFRPDSRTMKPVNEIAGNKPHGITVEN